MKNRSLLDRLFYSDQKGATYENAENDQYLKMIVDAMRSQGFILPSDDPTNYVKDGYAGNADIYAIINYIITTAANVPFKAQIFEKGEWVDDPASELIKLINKPNPLTTRSLYIQETLGWKLISGIVYTYGNRLDLGPNKGKPTQIWVMPSVNMNIIGGDSIGKPIEGYRYTMWQEMIPVDNMMVNRYFNPMGAIQDDLTQNLTGLSPLRAMALTAEKSNSGAIAEISSFKNNGAIGIISKDNTLDGDFTDKQKGNLIENWKKLMGGADKQGSVAYTSANIKWNDISRSPADMNIVDSDAATKRKLASGYKFPTQLINDASGATFSNQNEAQKSVYTNTIIPEMNEIGEGLINWLGDAYYPKQLARIIADTSGIEVLQTDKKEQAERLALEWWKTPNEKRREQNDEPIEGFDEPMVPGNFVPLSAMKLQYDLNTYRQDMTNDSRANS